MKFIHTADWHLGKLFYGSYLTDEQEWILDNQFLPLLDEEKPDAVILAGDVYDRSVPPSEAVELFNHMVNEICLSRHIPLLVISGNHDSAERLSFGSSLLKEAGLFITGTLDTAEAYSVEDKYGTVEIYPLPYADPGAVRHFLSCEDIHDHDDAEKALAQYLLSRRNKNSRKIAIAHEYVAGGTPSDSERPLSIGGTEMVAADTFKDFNYTALGHLHRPQTIGNDNIRYSGSLLKYSFSETGYDKGVIVGEIDGEGQVETRFVPLIPKHNVRIIRGTFDELMKREDDRADDFLRADLQDNGPVVDAMARLRTRYPNLMTLTTKRVMSEDEGTRNIDLRKKISDIDMVKTFMNEFRNTPLSDEEENCLTEILKDMEGGENE